MSLRSRLTCLSLRGRIKMSIDARCQEQLRVAAQMFMDFKYTPAGSTEQQCALASLHQLILQWIGFDTNAHLTKKDLIDVKTC